jgi:hypothetical protein
VDQLLIIFFSSDDGRRVFLVVAAATVCSSTTVYILPVLCCLYMYQLCIVMFINISNVCLWACIVKRKRRFSFALHACVVPLISASACVLPRETTMHASAWYGHGNLSAQTRTPRLVTGRAWGSAGPSSVPGDHDFTTDSGPALRWAGWNDARGKTDSEMQQCRMRPNGACQSSVRDDDAMPLSPWFLRLHCICTVVLSSQRRPRAAYTAGTRQCMSCRSDLYDAYLGSAPALASVQACQGSATWGSRDGL